MSRDVAQVFADIDACDGDRFVAHLTPDVRFRFTNADPVTGRDAVKEAVEGFWSTIDGLTQVYNKRYFAETIEREIGRAQRYRRDLSLILFDIDHFKNINDTFGHLAGDYVLKALATVIKGKIRREDVLARYGGEEFAIILPQTGKPGAAVIAERICAEFRKLDLPVQQADRWLKVTGSLGVAGFPEDAESPEGLIQQADIALYSAKLHGKDQVVVFERH